MSACSSRMGAVVTSTHAVLLLTRVAIDSTKARTALRREGIVKPRFFLLATSTSAGLARLNMANVALRLDMALHFS